MAIAIEETFEIHAPIETVWQFLLDPQRVVVCMPGAELEEVVGDGTFLGNIRIKVGPITSAYKGRVQFTEVDEAGHMMKMVAEGRESSGGIAKGAMSSRLRALPDGGTEVAAESSVEITGRIMQFGRGMIEDVSHQLFQQFVACVKERLEAGEGATVAADAAVESEPISVLPLALQAMGRGIVRSLRRLLRRPAA